MSMSSRAAGAPVIKMVFGGDLFKAPPNSILIHACNTLGSWGSGVAAAFKSYYPGAHSVHVSHCKSRSGSDLVGSTLLIPPQSADIANGKHHWIACLFTSVAYGKAVDPPEKVLANTEGAMSDLWKQVQALEKYAGEASPGEWHSAKINSVRFKVPWEETAAVIERVLEGSGKQVVVYEYDEAVAGVVAEAVEAGEEENASES